MHQYLMRFRALLMMIPVLVVLQGCGSLGFAEPKSTEDRIQYARAQVSAAYRSVGDLAAAKAVDQPTGQRLFSRVQAVETQVETADKLMQNGRPGDAQQTLQLAMNVLLVIQGELKAKQQK